jgi:hypothetical protein
VRATELLADAIAAYYVPAVIAIAIAHVRGLVPGRRPGVDPRPALAVAVLIIAGPCALGPATDAEKGKLIKKHLFTLRLGRRLELDPLYRRPVRGRRHGEQDGNAPLELRENVAAGVVRVSLARGGSDTGK